MSNYLKCYVLYILNSNSFSDIMINYYRRRLKDKELTKLNSFEVGSWINVVSPSESEIKNILEMFSLDSDLVNDALDDNELPGIYINNDIIYIYIKTVNDKRQLITVLIVLTDKFILTLCKENVSILKELLSAKKLMTTQIKKFALEFLALNNDYLEDIVMSVVKQVNAKKSYNKKLSEKDLSELLTHEELLNNLASAYTYTLRLYNKMNRKIEFFETDVSFFEDLMIESEQGLNVCVNSLKTISNIRNHYTLILSNKLNRTLTILTIFTILVSISTAVSGIYGMNINLPLQNVSYAFYYIIILIFGLMLLFLYYLRRNELI